MLFTWNTQKYIRKKEKKWNSYLQAIFFAPLSIIVITVPTFKNLKQLNVVTKSGSIRKTRFFMLSLLFITFTVIHAQSITRKSWCICCDFKHFIIWLRWLYIIKTNLLPGSRVVSADNMATTVRASDKQPFSFASINVLDNDGSSGSSVEPQICSVWDKNSNKNLLNSRQMR